MLVIVDARHHIRGLCAFKPNMEELNAGLNCIQNESWYPYRGITDVRKAEPKQHALEVPPVL